MKKIILNLAIFTTLIITSITAIAENTGKIYTGLGSTQGIFSVDGKVVYPNAELFSVGKYFNDNFALESRIGIGGGLFDTSEIGSSHTFELEKMLGVYGVGHYYVDFRRQLSFYGVIGVSVIRRKGVEFERGERVSFGAGFSVSNNNEVYYIEFMDYFNQLKFAYSTIGAGFKIKFR